MTARRLRVVVVDDSLFMRAAVKKILEADGRFEVVATAKDGQDGVERVVALRPDVVTMDFNMPRMDGRTAVLEIMARAPTPVMMLSAHTFEGARETMEALAAGAVDFLAKPSGEVSTNLEQLAPQLIAKLLEIAHAVPRRTDVRPPTPERPASPSATWPSSGARICVIGVSTGGPAALSHILPRLPGDLGIALLIVQHMPAPFTAALAERLDALSAIEVREARSGDRPRQALALVAPGDVHLELDSQGLVRLHNGPEVNGCRPSADVTLRSAARIYGRRTFGLIMTGMGRDGADGLAAVRAAGGLTMAQDRESSVIWGMPRAAIESGCVAEIISLDEIPHRLARL